MSEIAPEEAVTSPEPEPQAKPEVPPWPLYGASPEEQSRCWAIEQAMGLWSEAPADWICRQAQILLRYVKEAHVPPMAEGDGVVRAIRGGKK